MLFRIILLSAIGVLAFSSPSAGQENADSRMRAKHFIGIKGGQNFSWVRFDPGVAQNIQYGPVFGIAYSYMSEYYGGVLIEAQYIKFGWEEIFIDSTNTYTRELSYLEMPILTNLVIGNKNTHLKFQGGIRINYLLDETENSEVDEELAQYYHGLPVDDNFELGLAFGISVSRVFSFGEIQIDSRFNLGLSNLFAPTEDLTLLSSQNQGLTFSLYYWLALK